MDVWLTLISLAAVAAVISLIAWRFVLDVFPPDDDTP